MESPPHIGPPQPPGPAPDETNEADAVTRAIEPPPADARHFHHYEICLREDGLTLHELGRGAMGISYKARDVNLDTSVAIKVINADLSRHDPTRERFRREARAAAQLRHPNVASVFHFGETRAGQCFYAMEFIEGETLAEKVRRDGPLPPALVVEIALQVTAALMAADEQGLVHRDLKPANLMLVAGRENQPPTRRDSRGSSILPGRYVTVKVIDFGLARAATAMEGAAYAHGPLTEGGFLGTPAYASPEQAEGGAVDARSDIYSLGVTLWYLLTGKIPFAGRSHSEIYDRQLHRPLPVAQLTEAQIPPSLVELLTKMLSADPSKRPASPATLYESLESCHEAISGSTPRDRPEKPESRFPRRMRVAIAAAALLLLLAAGAAVAYSLRPRVVPPNSQATTAATEKSIAVLPLEDLSEDKSNAYFADGIQDDLLSSLARIKELKVISRSSVMGYRDVAARNLRQIGQQLGVIYVLEGSVRRAPDRVLVNADLIDTRDGHQIWAEHYDRSLADALTLQGELATEIAAALRTTLSPEEKARVEARPTGNADAYVLYLRARDYQTRPYTLKQDYEIAARLFREALALDPGFILAHAQLSATLAYIYQNFQPTAEIREQARHEADEALRLRPDSGEGNLARALCLYMTEKNYDAALRELEVASRLLPGNAEVDFFSGAIRRRQGRWTQALASMKRALMLDPRSARIAREVLATDCMLRDWRTAAKDGARAAALAPDDPMLQIEKSYVDYWSHRDLGALRGVLAGVPAGVDPDGEITSFRWDMAMLERNFAEAERAASAGALETVVTPFGATLPKSYLLGCTAIAVGDTARAQPLLENARVMMEREALNVPLDPFRQANLGLLYAYLGRKEDALRQGRRAVELLPESKDACVGPMVSGMLALIYARSGEPEQALAMIERLLRTPAALLVVFDGSITQTDLRLRWQWDLLRADPRFQALLVGPEPKTAYK